MSVMTRTRHVVRRAGRSDAFETMVRVALLGYGILHLAVAWLAVQIATGRPAAEGDQSGAFRLLAQHPLGRLLVWAIALGLVAMAAWQLLEAAFGHGNFSGARRVVERTVSACRTIFYSALAWTAFAVLIGAQPSNANQQARATAGVLGRAGGQWLVGLAGVVVVTVGLVVAGYGLSRGFERRFTRSQMSGRALKVAVITGVAGYVIKGLAYAIVGVLLVIAAVTFDPEKSTGLDGALRTLAAQPFGEFLLGVVALGFAVYGVFCFLQSRYRKV
jgi:Domain of Unknown Function (DUF1206)